MTGLLAWGVALGVMILGCAQQSYVLPIADGGPEPSPPTLQGRISLVGNGQIEVRLTEATGRASHSVVVRVLDSTEIFTVYGGYVPYSKLVEGQAVRVWAAKPEEPRDGEVISAAVIMLASKDPGDGWPK